MQWQLADYGGIDRAAVISTWLEECMSRLKMELIFRLAEAPAVQQWLEVEQSRALKLQQHRLGKDEEEDLEAEGEPPMKEKMFLLTVALQISTNPARLPETLKGYLKEWVGNQYLCQMTHSRKLKFCHVNWLQYEQDDEDMDPGRWWAPFGDGPAELDLSPD